MTVAPGSACWCIFIRTGEDSGVPKLFSAWFSFSLFSQPWFLHFGKSFPPPLFSHLRRFPVVTICLQMFAPSFVPLRCLAKTIRDNYRAAVLWQIKVWKNHSCWSLLLPVPRASSVLQKQKRGDCFRVVFSSITKNVSVLSQCSEREARCTDCYLQSSLQ